jgi:hypothetical protein
LSKWLAVRPFFQSALTKIVSIIAPQHFQTKSRCVGELHLDSFRGAAGGAALDDVLRTAPRGLDHLVMSTATPIDVAFAETGCDVEAELRHLKAFQIPIPAMRRDETLAVRRLFGWSANGAARYQITENIQVICIVGRGYVSGLSGRSRLSGRKPPVRSRPLSPLSPLTCHPLSPLH